MSSYALSVQSVAAVASAARAPHRHHHRRQHSGAAVASCAKKIGRRPSRAVSCRASAEEAGVEAAEVLDGSSLFLVGMMGTGKSSVGKKLAAALGYNFFDT